MQTDFSKPSKEIVVDLINATHGTAFQPADLVFSPPLRLLTGPYDTSLVVAGDLEGKLAGQVGLHYNRVPLNAVAPTGPITIVRGEAATVADLLPSINAVCGTFFKPEDIQDAPLPEQTEASVPLVLQAAEYSLVYTANLALSITAPA